MQCQHNDVGLICCFKAWYRLNILTLLYFCFINLFHPPPPLLSLFLYLHGGSLLSLVDPELVVWGLWCSPASVSLDSGWLWRSQETTISLWCSASSLPWWVQRLCVRHTLRIFVLAWHGWCNWGNGKVIMGNEVQCSTLPETSNLVDKPPVWNCWYQQT